MAKRDDNNEGSMKAGTSRRSRLGREGRGATVPRVMILGLLVIVAGGAALFWPRGGSVPTGIGENQTVVSSPAAGSGQASTPHSVDVDINTEGTAPLTPEQEIGKTDAEPTKQAGADAAKPQPNLAEPKTAKQTTPKPSTTKPATTKASTQPKIQPSSSGPYAVQVGAFGEVENADTEAARLKARGWDARVRAGDNSSGNMVYRVWIVYFASRQEAQTFINQNNRYLAGSIPVHR